MQGLIIKHSEGQYDDYCENIDSLWIRDEPFDWPSLHAKWTEMCTHIRNENRGRKKNFLPEITLTQFLLGHDFIPVCNFDEQLD